MIRSVGAIATGSLRLAVRSRAFLGLTAIAVLVSWSQLVELHRGDPLDRLLMEPEELEAERIETIRASGAESFFDLWVDFAGLVGLFLGASAVSADLRSRRLEEVLPRPVPKPVYLVGRWLGIQALVLAFSAVGVVLVFFALRLPRLDPAPLLWLGLAQFVVTAMLTTTVAMALGTRLRPLMAGVLTVLVLTLPSLAMPYLEHSQWAVRWLAGGLYFSGPAVPMTGLISEALSQTPSSLSYRLPLLAVLENGLYTLAALAVGCLALQRRALRLPR